MAAPEIKTSPHKVDKYLQCPAMYQALYKSKFHEKAKEVSNPVTLAGTFVHKALEFVGRAMLPPEDGGFGTPGADRTVTREMVMHYLDVALRSVEKEGWKPQRELGIEAVKLATESLEKCWKKLDFTHMVAVERQWKVDVGPLDPTQPDRGRVVATGQFDRVDRLPDGTVVVVDWKSGFDVMSRADAEVDYQVNLYLVAAKAEFAREDDVDVGLRLEYLTRAVSVGPVIWTPFRDQWVRRLTTAVQYRISEDHAWQETPGLPHCIYCPRQDECGSFKKLVKGPLRAIPADLAGVVREYDRLRALHKVTERLKEAAHERITAEVRAAAKTAQGESPPDRHLPGQPLYVAGFKAWINPVHRMDYPDLFRTVSAAARMVFQAEEEARAAQDVAQRRQAEAQGLPPEPSAPDHQAQLAELSATLSQGLSSPEAVTRVLTTAQGIVATAQAAVRARDAAEDRVRELTDRCRKLEAFAQVASAVARVQKGDMDRWLATLPQETARRVVEAVDMTSVDAGYVTLNVQYVPSPFGGATTPPMDLSEPPPEARIENPYAELPLAATTQGQAPQQAPPQPQQAATA